MNAALVGVEERDNVERRPEFVAKARQRGLVARARDERQRPALPTNLQQGRRSAFRDTAVAARLEAASLHVEIRKDRREMGRGGRCHSLIVAAGDVRFSWVGW